jgi:OOP family OmpA-OmpF porin
MVRFVTVALSLSLMILLGACQSFIGAFSADDNIAAAQSAGPPAGAFNTALQQEYVGIAQTEIDEFDFQHADGFALKGIAAGNGEMVLPADPANWRHSAEKASELTASRGMLLDALDGGGRELAPADSARAQAMFDCWNQEEETANEGHQPDDIAFCRAGFWDALALVREAIKPKPMAEPAPIPPEPPARTYLVFFDFDKTDIRSDSASILERVIGAIAELGSNSVDLIGHTDTAGPATYNMGLSVRRADAVRDYLQGMGVSAAINTIGRGEDDPRVPTPDGVAEQENRRVEIHIN